MCNNLKPSSLVLPKSLYSDIMSDNPSNPSLSPALLGFIILICFFGLLPNSYAANYMRNNFDLSKMVYKTLLRCCLINAFGFIVLLITALFLLNSTSKNELICIIFQTSLTSPIFIVQSCTLQISILRCIISCSKKNEEELNNFQKTVAAVMTPFTPSNSEIICVQNVGAKVEMVSYLKK